MSLTGDRDALAALLDAVANVKGYAYRPRAPRPGDAWPTLPALELQGGLVWRPTWTVIVFLPQDERRASEWIDDNFDVIAAALRGGQFFPVSAEPGIMTTSAGDHYVMEFTVRSH